MDPIEQIKRAIVHIEERLFERIPVQELAREACASRFHFHRLFRSITGTSVYQYILSRKLSEASRMLIGSEKPIGDIADAVGFESHEGFSRAFKKRIGISPNTYRSHQQYFSIMPALDLHTGSLRCGIIQEPRMVDFPGVLLAGVCVHGYSRAKVTEAWFQLLSQAKSIPHLTEKWDSFGILKGNSWNHESDHYCFTACKQVTRHDAYPMGIDALQIPAGKCFQAMVRGRRKNLTEFYQGFAKSHGIAENAWIIEYQDEYFLSPEISPRVLMIFTN